MLCSYIHLFISSVTNWYRNADRKKFGFETMLHSTNSQTLESAIQKSGQGSQDRLKAKTTTCGYYLLPYVKPVDISHPRKREIELS